MTKCKYYKPYMDTLKKMCKEYYKLEGCGSGGPLHVLLDDDNYNIQSVHFCMNECIKGIDRTSLYPLSANIMGIIICNEYAKMTLEERATFDALWCDQTLNCHGKCEDCAVRDELYEYMKEMEEADAN